MTIVKQRVSEEDRIILSQLQIEWSSLTKRYGELHFEMLLIDERLALVENKRREMVSALQKQFGSVGTVDLKTGEFVPDREEKP